MIFQGMVLPLHGEPQSNLKIKVTQTAVGCNVWKKRATTLGIFEYLL